MTGLTQVTSKACTTLALANGLSFPVATLAKSGKMAPVMLGSLLLGGAKYGFRDYLQVVAIIGGTAIVSMDKSVSRKFIEKLSFSFHHLYFSEVILQLYTFLWRKEKWNRQQHCWSIFHHSFSYL